MSKFFRVILSLYLYTYIPIMSQFSTEIHCTLLLHWGTEFLYYLYVPIVIRDSNKATAADTQAVQGTVALRIQNLDISHSFPEN